MKFLLRNWQKNRYDLVRKPVNYPPSVAGDALRECIRQAKASPQQMEDLRQDVITG